MLRTTREQPVEASPVFPFPAWFPNSVTVLEPVRHDPSGEFVVVAPSGPTTIRGERWVGRLRVTGVHERDASVIAQLAQNMIERTGWEPVPGDQGRNPPAAMLRRSRGGERFWLTLEGWPDDLRVTMVHRRGRVHGADPLVISPARMSACPRSPGGTGATYRNELAGAVTDSTRLRALAGLPAAARRTALAAGLEALIADLLLARARDGQHPTLETLALRQQLDRRLAALQPQLLAVEFEAECNIALMAEALAQRDDDRNQWAQRFTVASLVAGAASVLVSAAWDLTGTQSDGPLVAGLVGAGITTVLGFKALSPPGRRIVFMHDENLLTPIVQGEDPQRRYPTFVYRLLTLPMPADGATPRERLNAEWRRQLESAVPATQRDAAAQLLWGRGGSYDDDTLALRRRLYEALEAMLDSFARDVDALNAALTDGA